MPPAPFLRSVVLLASCLLLPWLGGCDEERPSMPVVDGLWQAIDLPLLTAGTNLDAVTFAGNTGYILGSGAGKAGTNYVLLVRDPERHWVARRMVDAPDNAVLLDVAAGASGLAVGGYLQQLLDPALVYDERGEVASAIARSGVRIAAVDGDDALMIAGGTATGGALWASRVPGAWSNEPTPLSQVHTGGFTDVFVGNGRALACGFDNGSDTPQVVLSLDNASGTWSKLPLGSGVLGLTLKCVAVDESGVVVVGGVADTGGSALRAFLRVRSADGVWSQLALPDSELIGGVNDVLPAGGGHWLVACGGEGGAGLGTILRLDGNGFTREMTPFNGAVLQLARDADGLVHAVGYKLSAGASLHLPLALRRG